MIAKIDALPLRIAALGMAAGMLTSLPLWTDIGRTIPRCPLLPYLATAGVSSLPDQILAAVIFVCALTILCNRARGVATIILVAALAGDISLDLNRFQPWVYEYLIVIVIFLGLGRCGIFSKKCHTNSNGQSEVARRTTILIAAIYFFSGLQKFNWRFIAYVGPWLLGATNSPATACAQPIAIIGSGVMAIVETSIGLALIFGRTRKITACIAIIMHLLIIYTLSIKFKINAAIVPWNLAQIALLATCVFQLGDFSLLRRPKLAAINIFMAIACLIIPILGLFQIADPYPSFAFYTGDIPYGQIYFDKPIFDKLPPNVQKDVAFFDKEIGLWVIDFLDWSNYEMGVPNYSSAFCVKKMARAFAKKHPGDFVILETSTYPKLNNLKLLKYEQLGGTPEQLAAIRQRLGTNR